MVSKIQAKMKQLKKFFLNKIESYYEEKQYTEGFT